MKQFSGFSVAVSDDTDLYDAMRLSEEATLLAKALLNRLGSRVRKNELDSGWDTRPNRDYFYSNYIFWTRLKDPSYIGIFHYRKPEPEGTRFQCWRYEFDDAPVVDLPIKELYSQVKAAADDGRIGDYLDAMAEDIRLKMNLR